MPEEKTNIEWLQEAIHHINRLNLIVRQYEKAVMRFEDGSESPIDPAKITELKQAGAAHRTSCINALNSIST
jgi:hypothetical protein